MNKYSTCAVAYLITGICVFYALRLTNSFICLLALGIPLAILEMGSKDNK